MKAQFIAEVGRTRHFWMGGKRKQMASALFDKYTANYNADPPIVETSTAMLTPAQAKAIATKYSVGLTLTPDELKPRLVEGD
jgi:hypothetical protein